MTMTRNGIHYPNLTKTLDHTVTNMTFNCSSITIYGKSIPVFVWLLIQPAINLLLVQYTALLNILQQKLRCK